jgi:hypothetical protein
MECEWRGLSGVDLRSEALMRVGLDITEEF